MPIYFSEEEQELRKIKIKAIASQLDAIDEQVKILKQSKKDTIKSMGFEYDAYLRLRKKFNI